MQRTTTLFLSALIIVGGLSLISSSNGPTAGVSGSPADGGKTCATCHSGPSGTGNLQISGTTDYEPGKTYTFTVSVNDESSSTFGFQAIALNNSESSIGKLTASATNGTKIYNQSGNEYIEHSKPSNVGTFTFDWTAPENDEGDITLYAAGNAANGDGTISGDFIYSSSIKIKSKSTNISEIIKKQIAIYPNPSTNGSVQINFGELKVSTVNIFDISGKEIAKYQKGKSLTLNNLQKGIYLLQVVTDEGSATKRIEIK